MSQEKPSAAEQAAAYEQAAGESFAPELGKIYYAVNQEWFSKWKRFSAGEADSEEPGIINNTELSEQAFPQALRRGLLENMDYAWIIEPAYKLLAGWYGVINEFPRKVVETSDGNTKVDGYPQVCTLTSSKSEEKQTLLLPRTFKAKEILEEVMQNDDVRKGLGLEACTQSDLRIFAFDSNDNSEDAWNLMVNNTSVDDVARNDPETKLLVEVREADGSWKRGIVYGKGFEPLDSGLSTEKWRQNLKVGSHLDARDREGKWWDATIVDVKKPGLAAALYSVDEYTVHFRAWSSEFDEKKRSSEKDTLLPLYSKTSRWRQALRPGDACEISRNARWFPAFVLRVDFTVLPQAVTVVYEDATYTPQTLRCSVEDDCVAKAGSHVSLEKMRFRPVQAPKAPSLPSFIEATNTQTNTAITTVARYRAYGDDDEDPQVGGAAAGATGNAAVTDPRELAKVYRRVYFGDNAATWKTMAGRGVPGVCGLDNLGNTCFMNSMLQCLSNTKEFTEFFLDEDQYIPQINATNRLGSGGKLVHAYAALIQALWCGAFSRAAPGTVKAVVAKHFPQFMGWGQQDSQEFMSSFLDLMMEDLCRVADKPTLENPDSEGRSDESVAAESWSNYLRRNDSKVLDALGGQFRSHVQCNQCDRESVTFDPFTCFSVPIPVDNWTNADITYYGHKNCTPIVFRYFYRKPQPPQVSELASWLLEMLAKEKEALASSHPDLAAEHSTMPTANELLFALCTVSPNVIRTVLPHWANLGAAITSTSKNVHGRLMLTVWHVPGAAKYATAEAAVEAPVDGGDQVEDWPIDYDEALPSNDADDDDFSSFYRRTETKYKERPAGPLGPHMNDFVALWCRRKVTTYSTSISHVGLSDSIVVPTHYYGEGPVKTMTNNQFRQLVWERVQRFLTLPEGHEYTAANPPYRLCVFNYIYEKRKYLPNDFERHHDYVDFPADDEQYIPKKDAQIIIDFDGDKYRDLVNIDALKKNVAAETTKVPPHKKQLSLETCIESFAQREQLGEADMWYCNKCKTHVRAFKKMDLWKLPPVLIVHLKRFQYERGFYGSVLRGKIDEMVHFPTRGLDMAPYIVGPDKGKEAIYDLYAVSQHSGGMGGGHYTAHAMNHRNKKWYNFNDSYVSDASEHDAVGRAAYVLFYRLREPGSELLPATIAPPRPAEDDEDMD